MRDALARMRRGERMPWRQWRWLFGAVWLVFLAFPVSAVVDSDHPMSVKVLGLVDLALFAAVYLAACIVYMSAFPAERGRTVTRGHWVFATVLTALALALFPVIEAGAFALAGFLMAIVSFIAPRRVQVTVIVVLIVAAYTVPRLLDWDVDFSIVAIMIAIGTTMIAIRAVSEQETKREAAEDRRRRLDSQLALVAERERVARDVHDILGHSLTVISVKSELAGRLVDVDPGRARTEMAEVNALSREALTEVRATVGRLRTPDLTAGLAAAASALHAAGIVADLPEPAAVDTDHEVIFAWVLREAVTNVVRHSGASTCRVEATPHRLSVRDDGIGSPTLVYGNGLRGLSDRVRDAGGALTVVSDETGTAVTVTMPRRDGMDR